MDSTLLEFNNTLYTQEEIDMMINEFQIKGYAVLPNIFQRESVPLFKDHLEHIMYNTGLGYTLPDDSHHYLQAALAPKARQVLPYSLSGSQAKLMPSIHTTIIVIETNETKGKYAPGWHKDRQPDGMPGKEYHYPADVFLAFYFEDMDEDNGPTQIIPGSHRNISLQPGEGALVESITLNMEDAVLLDQRAWHRGIPRNTEGTRFVIVYGIYGLPHYYGNNVQMPRIQMKYWMNAKTVKDRVYFGGPFAPPTIMKYDSEKLISETKQPIKNQFQETV